MINIAVDLFNTVHQSVVFVEETVVQLRRPIRHGDIRPGEGVTLTDEEEAMFVRSAADLKIRLDRVRAELQLLKQFYLR
jgi:hypothetical protein